ncbi:MAG: HAMP domain-containing histidine kinase [Clostridia bacterium]|nr:HAMP domain-containing histidine kinase [Clostridia bacterium]
MIRRMQRQLVLVAAGAIAVLLSMLLAVLNLYNFRSTRQSIYARARLLAEQGGELTEVTGEEEISDDEAELTVESPYQMRYFSVRITEDGAVTGVNLTHIAAIDRSRAIRWAKTVQQLRRPEGLLPSGRFVYAYSRRPAEGGSTLVVFLDCTGEVRASRQLLRHSIVFGILTLALFTAVIFLLSKRIMDPFIRSMESQEQFITNAGHELKTPLAIIAADAEFLEMTAGESEWTASIRAQVARMTTLVARLIRLAKLAERKEVQLIEQNLSPIVKEATEAFRPLAEQQKKGLTVQVPEEVRGFVTRDGFTELVSILVDNAVKYCDDGGEVRVGLLKKGRGKGCHLRVSNAYAAGRGMDMSRFFDRFYRADQSHSSEKKGYGIGLSMAEGLAREFHGRIAAEYKNGVITFVVTLP